MNCFNCLAPYDDPQATRCSHCGAALLIKDERGVKLLNSNRYAPVIETESVGGERKIIRIVRDSSRIERLQEVVMGLRITSGQSSHSFCPNVIDTFFWRFDDSEEPIYCMLLEKIEGASLQDYVKRHDTSDEQVITWMLQLFEMVDTFHEQGWLLRDIKPENLVINREGRLIFVDIDSLFHLSWDIGSLLWHLSSPGYTAPEQNDRQPSPASDLFSIGRTAIFCLTGQSPAELYDESGFAWRHGLKKSSPLVLDLVERLVSLNPIERPRVRDSINYLELLPAKIRKQARWDRYKWPVTIVLSLIALGVLIPLERRWTSWSRRIRADQQQLVGNVEQAHALYERSLLANSNNAAAYSGLGLTCSEVQCGIGYLEQAMALAPDDDSIKYNLAVLYESVDPQRSLGLYESVSFESERYELAQNNLARVNIQHGDYAQALAILEPLIEQGNDDRIDTHLLAKAYKNTGWAYLQMGDYPKAQERLEQSVSLDPLPGDGYCMLALIEPKQTDLFSCFYLNSQSPESKKIKTQLFSQYLIKP